MPDTMPEERWRAVGPISPDTKPIYPDWDPIANPDPEGTDTPESEEPEEPLVVRLNKVVGDVLNLEQTIVDIRGDVMEAHALLLVGKPEAARWKLNRWTDLEDG